MKVDREQIIEAALQLLDEVGIDKLSTRLIAQRLEVQQPALYWHFKSKQVLLAAMNTAMLARAHLCQRPMKGAKWNDFLRDNARSFRTALLTWRDGAKVHIGTQADPTELGDVEIQLKLLTRSGMRLEFAMDLLVALNRFTVGCVLEEQAALSDQDSSSESSALDAAAADFPLTSQALVYYKAKEPSAQFEAGLNLLIMGADAAMRTG